MDDGLFQKKGRKTITKINLETQVVKTIIGHGRAAHACFFYAKNIAASWAWEFWTHVQGA